MNNRKRLLRRILCIAGVLLCLASCGRERYELKTEVSQVYKATVLELPDPDYRVSMGEGPVWNGERFSVQSFLLDKEVGGLFLDFSKTYSFLPDGTEILEEVPAPKVETVQSGSYPQDVRTFANGETLFTEVVQNGDKLRLFLSLRDDRSEPVFSVDLAGEFQFDYTRMKDGSGTFTFLNAVYDETDGECRYLVLTSEGLCVLIKTENCSGWMTHGRIRFPSQTPRWGSCISTVRITVRACVLWIRSREKREIPWSCRRKSPGRHFIWEKGMICTPRTTLPCGA